VSWIYFVQNTRLVGSYEHGNKPFGSTKYWKILNYLRKYWLLRKDSYPRCLSVHGKTKHSLMVFENNALSRKL